MNTRSKSTAVLLAAIVGWTLGGGPAAAQLVSSFENDLSSAYEGVVWEGDGTVHPTYVTTGATDGSTALEIKHPGNWTIQAFLRGGLPLAQDAATHDFLLMDVTTTDIGEAGDGVSPSWREAVVVFNANPEFGNWQQTSVPVPVASDDGGFHTEPVIVDLVSSGIQANAAAFVNAGGGEGMYWELFLALQGGDQGISKAGNYVDDTTVDAADYTAWRDNLGGTTLPNETASLGVVDQADYEEWKANFGHQFLISTIIDNIRFANAGAGSVAGAVPEPASGLLAVGAMAACLAARRRRELT
jgi:hypothetical protein